MTVIIKDLNGNELLNALFAGIDISNNIYSIKFTNTNLIQHTLQTGKIYNVTFVGVETLGITGTVTMSYVSYHYSASTSISTNENGNQVSSISVNANSIILKEY